MTINFETSNITPTVLSEYRGNQNVLKEITYCLLATNTESGAQAYVTRVHTLDIDREYTAENPFIPFENFTAEQINSIIQEAIHTCSWDKFLEKKLQTIAAESNNIKTFSFQD